MTPDALLSLATTLPRETLMLGGGAIVVLLLLLLVLLIRRRSRRPENIGLRRIEADYGEAAETGRQEPGLPEPDWDPLEHEGMTTIEENVDPQGHRVTERINEATARVQPAAPAVEPPVRPTAPAPGMQPEPEPKPVSAPVETPDVPRFSRPAQPWHFLQTLPFVMRRGLSTAHVDMLGISVEAVFFTPEAAESLSDPVSRLLPFLPDGEILFRESDHKTFSMGSLFAQPDAVIEIEAGLISLEYKSRGGRNDNPADPASTLRPKDLLQTLIEAMVLSVSTGRPVAPVLRTHNAAYFLRPERRIMALLADRIAAAEDFVSPYSERRGISAGDYAALCVVPAEMLFTRPANASSLAGEAAHKSLLG